MLITRAFFAFFIPSLLLPLWSLRPLWSTELISQFLDHFTDGRTPRTGDQLVARSLPVHRTTQLRKTHTDTPNIHDLSGIRTHDPGFQASEDSTWLRPLGYRDRLNKSILI
jgi:hypothetical protein